MPAVGFRHCLRERRAAVFAASLAAGVAARTAAAARRAGTSIGARKDQRMHHIAFWCCSVDSDAVLLRARHGGRHEGGGRRQRKRDEELVHLICALASCEMADVCVDSAMASIEAPRYDTTALGRAMSGLRQYLSGLFCERNRESAGRARDTRSISARLPSRQRRARPTHRSRHP